jgi:hypothetical protein
MRKITNLWGRRGRDRMVAGFITPYAISAYRYGPLLRIGWYDVLMPQQYFSYIVAISFIGG